ncbi:CpaD family pilus assembly lipoprotein [Marinomonas posidonica]|uniref:CpaD family pilus assembly lipoprotein n=1 Tax=Marinomonas posidonica TaxID=936476 RepID=UPI003736EBD9
MRFIAFSVLGLILLSGCDHTVHQLREGPVSFDSDANRSYTVKPTASSISLIVKDSGGLDKGSLRGLNALLNNQGRISNQKIRIQALTEKGESFTLRLKQSLIEAGLIAQNVTILPYVYRENIGKWDVKLTSEALVVVKADCAIADDKTWTVNPYEGVGVLGCANRSNIAQMVVNPRDLMRPGSLDSADAVTAVGAMTRYQEAKTIELLDIDFSKD